MKIVDAHCDVLWKIWEDENIDFEAAQSESLHVTLPRLQEGKVMLQSFAVYLPPEVCSGNGFAEVLKCIDYFYQRILSCNHIQFIRKKSDLAILNSSSKIGALLTLEGVDALNQNFVNLRTLFYLGVRMIGVTWNYANWAADGVLETRQSGLSKAGRQLIKECNSLGMLLDASHLNEKGFWELIELSNRPIVATHSNAYKVCPHPRNLTDEQITALIDHGGRIGLTFVPQFVSRSNPSIHHLLNHIDHICALGGSRIIGFGSDFDGIETLINGIEHAGMYENILNILLQHYDEGLVKCFISQNWLSYYENNLPQ